MATQEAAQSKTSEWPGIACWCVLAAMFLLLYASTIRGLFDDWWNDPDYSHGLVVPFVAAYFIYLRRNALRQLPVRPLLSVAFAVLFISQLDFLAGYFGAEFFLQRSSIVLFAVGMILLLWGKAQLRMLALPLLLIELCIPLPAVIMHQVTMPLQLIASAASEAILDVLGVPVYRAGNLLQMPYVTLNVAEACSGIRSLVSLIILAVIMASFTRLRWVPRILFIGSAVGVAIVANGFRISATALLEYYGGRRYAVGGWHLLEGWSVFVVAFLLLSVELKLICWAISERESES